MYFKVNILKKSENQDMLICRHLFMKNGQLTVKQQQHQCLNLPPNQKISQLGFSSLKKSITIITNNRKKKLQRHSAQQEVYQPKDNGVSEGKRRRRRCGVRECLRNNFLDGPKTINLYIEGAYKAFSLKRNSKDTHIEIQPKFC